MSSEAAKPQKTVLLGVTGGIAAYKSCEIVRGLQKAGVRVKVCMTEHATHFVDPVTFRSLTHEKVAVDLFDDPTDPIHHISLAEEADVFVIAPCTANVLAKLANGIADDLLTTTALACTARRVGAGHERAHVLRRLPTATTSASSASAAPCSSRPMRDTWHVAMWDAAVWPTLLPSLRARSRFLA